ncbi:hypothetical protein HMPREF1550_01842 [Actinomyces sp. oral taxon 877 str. F0543]|nr:hypothetical protein HMPREF1550_01842 [Actinomyces sp. oral taxon 877 str. F0543]
MAPTRVVDTDARYIPLTVSTTPSRCQQPPRGADNARRRSRPGRARARPRSRPFPQPARLRTQGPRFTQHESHTRTESSPCVRCSVS